MRLFAMLTWLVYCVVFLPLCSSSFAKNVRSKDDWFHLFPSNDHSKETALIEGLQKIFNFFYSDYERVNLDGLLGIIIAEAQLNIIIQKLLVKSILFDKVLELQNTCHNIIKLLKSEVKISSPTYNKIYKNLLDSSIWETENTFVNGSLKNLTPFNWTDVSTETLLKNVFYKGTPTGKQSEKCINEIIDLKLDNSEAGHDCLPSIECTLIMSQLDRSHGYPLTHKLLYIQLAKNLQCKTDDEQIRKSVNHLCSRILQEFLAIENIPVKRVLIQDLYLEQMVLCGMEGFAEFLTQKSRDNLLLWQSPYGCYGIKVPQLSDRWLHKRDISFMEYGCESHITGLAAAAIAINLNFLISTEPRNLESNEQTNFGNILMFSNQH